MEQGKPTYEQYKASGGELDEAAFASSLPHALSAVRDAIFPNEPDGSDEWMRAVFAAVAVDASYGASGGVAEGGSFSIGSFSYSEGSSGVSSYRADMDAAIRRELIGTGLLFSGIGGIR